MDGGCIASAHGRCHAAVVSLDFDVYSLAGEQGGVVTRSQARRIGMSEASIDRRLASGIWIRVADGAYRLVRRDSKLDLVRAAVAVLPGAVASHESAAAVHGIDLVDRDIVAVTVDASTTHRFDGVVVHRCRDLGQADRTTVNGLAATTVGRTVVDLSATLSPRHVEAVIDNAVAGGLVRWEVVEEIVSRIGRRGKPGIAALRRILVERLGSDRDASALERRGISLLAAGIIPEFDVEFPLPWNPDRRFDVAFPHHRLAIEWDSRRWHTQVAAFDADRGRDRTAATHGWQVLRFTWTDVHERPDDVVDTVRRALKARRTS